MVLDYFEQSVITI